MALTISDERKTQLIAELRGFYEEEFEEKISSFRAEQLVELFLRKLGPAVYNQGVQDARAHMQSRLDDLEGEVYASDAF
jgi:uncharacterized protein (DUF2164 family)